MTAPRDKAPDRLALEIEANEPRLRSAMSALGLTEEGVEMPKPVKMREPDPPREFDNGTPMIRLTRHGARWLIAPVDRLPRSDFERLLRCLRADGAFFGRYGTPHKSWSVPIEYGAQTSLALINSGFSITIAAASQAASLPPSGELPPTVSTPDVLSDVASGAAAGGRR